MQIKTDISYDLLYYNRYNGKATLLVKEYTEPKSNYFLPSDTARVAINKQRLIRGIKQKTPGGIILGRWFTLYTEVGKIDCYLRIDTYSSQVEGFFKEGMCIRFKGIYPNITCRLYNPNKLICEGGKAYDITNKLRTHI